MRHTGRMATRRGFLAALAAPAIAQSQARVEQWGLFETTLRGPQTGNPFDVVLTARFRRASRIVEVDGFHDGAGDYRIRFSPPEQGEWTWETRSSAAELTNRRGSFVCFAPGQGNHGPVGVRETHHFAYADGAIYRPFGTTCYAWTHQPAEMQRQTLATLAPSPFNKLRMCVFPKHYAYNSNEPPYYPFTRDAQGRHDFARPDPAFWRHLESRILGLQRLGIEADLILFHPYDRWGYANMGAEADARYVRYAVARLAAFRNVWWSMANEYNFVKTRSVDEWEQLAALVKSKDPYGRLISIHNGGELENLYDHSRPWITHVSVQSRQMTQGRALRERYRKPVIYDECQYEGNLPRRWGDISAREMVNRFWQAAMEGCYAGHGETYLAPGDAIWWSKGGVLRGESAARIGFLRRILDEGPARGLTPRASYYPSAGAGEEFFLYYFDFHQPASFAFDLPKDSRFQIDLIDPWEMTLAPKGVFAAGTPVELPSRPYLAARCRRSG
jgi:hypothetical protein